MLKNSKIVLFLLVRTETFGPYYVSLFVVDGGIKCCFCYHLSGIPSQVTCVTHFYFLVPYILY